MVALAVLLGAWIQSVAGLGMGLVAAPVVAVVAPDLMPELPLWFGLMVSASVLVLDHRHVDWRAVGWTLPARAVGTVPGVWLVVVFTDTQIGVAVGVMVLVAVLVSWRTLTIPVTPATMVAAGFVGGVGGTATSIAGPAVALLFQHGRPSEVRATLAVFFAGGVLMSLTGLAVAGRFTTASMGLAALCAPLVALGLWVGTRTRDRLPRERFRRVVLLVCAASAIALLVRALG
ncbi:MAG: TSUP family transporter [Nocardioides sp.]